jgi:hypothetical protein
LLSVGKKSDSPGLPTTFLFVNKNLEKFHMQMLKTFLILAVCFVSGCAYQTPPRTDPLADLLGGAKVSDSATRQVSNAKTKTLALIVSTSSETQIKFREENERKYLEEYIKTWEPASYNVMKGMYQSVGPRKLIDTVLAELRPRFSKVVVVNDLAEFREQGFDVAAVIDIGMEAKASSSVVKNAAEYTTEVVVILFDKQIGRIGVAKGRATEAGERSNAGDFARAFLLILPDPKPEEVMEPLVRAEQKSRNAAFAQLRQSLDTMIFK